MHLRRPTYPEVASTLAVVLALSTGSAHSAGLIGTKDLADSAVTSAKIRNGQVKTKDLSADVRGQLGGAVGPAGPAGAPGARGVSAWETMPPGTTVTGRFYDGHMAAGVPDGAVVENVEFPATAPAAPTGLGFGEDAFDATATDPTCTGSYATPTAPPGRVCVYMNGLTNLKEVALFNWANPAQQPHAFYFRAFEAAVNAPVYYWGSWAYTAPN